MTVQELHTRYGTMFVPDTDSGQYWWLANTHASPEDEFIEKVCDLLDERPRGNAIDVGANFGCWTLPLARHAEQVFAFEPQRCCYDLIGQSVAANSVLNVRLFCMAAGDTPGRVAVPDLDIDVASNFGGVTLVTGRTLGVDHEFEQPDAPMREVPVVVLDEVANCGHVSFIKIDVEGGELAVLRGARRIVAEHRPILMLEMDHPLTDLTSLESHIVGAGYAFDQYGPNYLCMPL